MNGVFLSKGQHIFYDPVNADQNHRDVPEAERQSQDEGKK